jgi:hypothetical protein
MQCRTSGHNFIPNFYDHRSLVVPALGDEMALSSAAIILASMLATSPAAEGWVTVTMPRNPERPMNAKTCIEAEARLKEAELGNPLIPKDRNDEILRQARAQYERRCSRSR